MRRFPIHLGPLGKTIADHWALSNWPDLHLMTETELASETTYDLNTMLDSNQQNNLTINKKLWEELTAFPLTRHGPHRTRRVQQFFYCCVRIRCHGNMFA
jgi:hypothetical protein